MNDRLPKGTPTEPGIYWARWGDFQWWVLLVEVDGAAPFLRCHIVWNRADPKRIGRVDIEEIEEFGARVPQPQ